MDLVKRFVEEDKFARLVGIELMEISEGRAKAKLEVGDKHLNGHGIVHGGAVFTLADLVFAAACNTYGNVAVAININITYFRATTSGTLIAEATEVDRNPRLGTYSITVKNDAGQKVALFQGLAYVKKKKLGE